MEESTPTLRDDVARLLKAEKPDLDTDDDTAFYSQIIDDYVDYARLLTADFERQDAQKAREEAAASSIKQLEGDYSAADIKEAVGLIDKLSAVSSSGNYDKDAIGLALCALRHDADVDKAREAAINEVLNKRTDGVPHLTGGCAGFPLPGNSIFDIARQA